MFLQYYGLREQPFGVTPNPRFLYHGPTHREALASLIYGIEADLGFAALIAEPGMGKTTLLFYLLEKFRPTARTALVFQTQCTPQELLRYVANEFEIEAAEDDPVILNDRIRQALVREARARRRVILIVDEAQNLSEESLEAIRLLSDFETPDFKLLHIILAGQPRLAEKLAQPGLAQLLQRIAMLNRLHPFTKVEDVARYISYRLKVAGYSGPSLFSQDALELITHHSGGIPRQINRLCFNALSLGCVTKKRRIDGNVLREVIKDLDLNSLIPRGTPAMSEAEAHPGSDEVAAKRVAEPPRASEISPKAAPLTLTQPPPETARSAQPMPAPDIATTVMVPATRLANGALSLSPSSMQNPERLGPLRVQPTGKATAQPQLLTSATQQSRTSAVKPARATAVDRTEPPNLATLARYTERPRVRDSTGLSLAWIVLCVIAVPLLILAAVTYAEHQHLLRGWEQSAPSSIPSAERIETRKAVNPPPANPDNSQKPKKQGPRSQAKPLPAAMTSALNDKQPRFGNVVYGSQLFEVMQRSPVDEVQHG